MTPVVEPLRGEVWEAHVGRAGAHPVVVLTADPVIGRLGHVTVAVVTGTPGPGATHVAIGADAGLTKYPESYVNVTDLHSLPLARLRALRGRLALGELRAVAERIRVYLGLDT